MLILVCATKRLSTSKHRAKTNEQTRICLSQVWKIQLPNVSIIYLLWSQANGSFSTQGWIRPRHRAVASITGLSGFINHRITRACGVCSSSPPISPILRVLFGFCSSQTHCFDTTMESHGNAPRANGTWACWEASLTEKLSLKISTTGNSHQSSTRQNSCYQPTSRGQMKGAAPCCLSPPLFHSLAAFVWLFPVPSSLVSF